MEFLSKKKGLSLDEKRQRMLDFFYEKLRNNIEKVMEDIQNTRNQISKTTKALDEALMKRKDTVNMHIDECLNTI
ncbi:unnamed protein product [Schistosoma mattheei]|uniref:Uncharacterized protein n=1 Tax=Schistosoma mattheei TaxID=31246 RepID=A0A183NV15_9TREM|nr:unnamed protein product [Schistosoma mattheei]